MSLIAKNRMNNMEDKIKVGISACLLGQKVRWNGGDSHDHFITGTLSRYLNFVPVCPEVECGFPVPRETLRLVGDSTAPRLVTTKTNIDHTERMLHWAGNRVKELESDDLCGFIFKSGSPSSGMERVKVYGEKGMPTKTGVGLFAAEFKKHFPLLPTEEEGRLHDPRLREHFIESIFVLKRWRDVVTDQPSRGKLVDFHTRHKLLFMAHSPKIAGELGKRVAQLDQAPLSEVLKDYQSILLRALSQKTTLGKNTNVLNHIMGYFKKRLSDEEKRELIDIIENYRTGILPLIVPVTLLNHYVLKYEEEYLAKQVYLRPHPIELKLRNHV
jgi:uncharacterized protein YbgA (DUF1722 family)/uncharacterized protein YbbK (DUF523 family)